MDVQDAIAAELAGLPDPAATAGDVRTRLTTEGYTIVDSAWLASVVDGANGPNAVPGPALRNTIAAQPTV